MYKYKYPSPPRRAALAAAALWLAGCASAPPPPRYVELTGPEREPYASLAWERWQRIEIAPPRRELERLSIEMTGKPMAWDPPAIPSWGGPYVFRDTFTGEIIADHAIGNMGYFEVTFTHGQPPRVARTYFTDRGRSARLTDVLELHRLSYILGAEWIRTAPPGALDEPPQQLKEQKKSRKR